MVHHFHDGMKARVLCGRESSKVLPVTNGINQARVLALTLISMLFTDLLNDAFQDNGDGITSAAQWMGSYST